MDSHLTLIVRQAIQEDLPDGDKTTDGLQSPARIGHCRVLAKEDLVLSGTAAFTEALHQLEPKAEIHWQFKDGDWVLNQQSVCLIKGDLVQILKAERVSLNFLGHLSGIASLTRCYVEQLEGLKTRLLDTRKTLPGLRALEKQAVVHGKGFNHRMNLSDAILIKENHIRLAGGIEKAVRLLQQNSQLPIEVECSKIEEVETAVFLKVSRIMLDNMSVDQVREALKLIPPSIQTEVSGNIRIENIREYAKTGVQFISVGALTHSAPNADLSLLFEWD